MYTNYLCQAVIIGSSLPSTEGANLAFLHSQILHSAEVAVIPPFQLFIPTKFVHNSLSDVHPVRFQQTLSRGLSSHLVGQFITMPGTVDPCETWNLRVYQMAGPFPSQYAFADLVEHALGVSHYDGWCIYGSTSQEIIKVTALSAGLEVLCTHCFFFFWDIIICATKQQPLPLSLLTEPAVNMAALWLRSVLIDFLEVLPSWNHCAFVLVSSWL